MQAATRRTWAHGFFMPSKSPMAGQPDYKSDMRGWVPMFIRLAVRNMQPLAHIQKKIPRKKISVKINFYFFFCVKNTLLIYWRTWIFIVMIVFFSFEFICLSCKHLIFSHIIILFLFLFKNYCDYFLVLFIILDLLPVNNSKKKWFDFCLLQVPKKSRHCFRHKIYWSHHTIISSKKSRKRCGFGCFHTLLYFVDSLLDSIQSSIIYLFVWEETSKNQCKHEKIPIFLPHGQCVTKTQYSLARTCKANLSPPQKTKTCPTKT